MNTDTEFETWVRAELHAVAETVRPAPDPYGRLVSKRRWSLFRRGFLAGVTALAAAVAGTLIALAPTGTPPPTPTPDFPGRMRWVASLVDAPPRGTVATDASFAEDLAARVEELSTRSLSPAFLGDRDEPLGAQSARLLFADDVGGQRIALLALQRRSIPDPYRRYPLTRLLWLAAPAGATPEQLAAAVASRTAPHRTGYYVGQAWPFAYAEFGPNDAPVRIVVAPPGCEVLTAPASDLTDWQREPGGSYLVRPPAQYVPEYWRVSCDGVVREERPAPRHEVTDADVDEVLARSPVQADRDSVKGWLYGFYGRFGFELIEPARVLVAGPVNLSVDESIPVLDFGQPDQQATRITGITAGVLAAPAARGGWMVAVSALAEVAPGRFTSFADESYLVETDPGAPDTLVALRIRGWDHLTLGLVPAGGRTLRVLLPDGQVIHESPLADRAFLVPLPPSTPRFGVTYQVLDASGTVMASAEPASAFTLDPRISNWD